MGSKGNKVTVYCLITINMNDYNRPVIANVWCVGTNVADFKEKREKDGNKSQSRKKSVSFAHSGC